MPPRHVSAMPKGRLLAFSDGVIAILITIMVLELRRPDGTGWPALRAELPVLFAYLLSFAYLGIYWNNHHHMFHAVQHVTGWTLWTNLHLLFWLSLVPFATSWMSEDDFPTVPVAVYGSVLLAAGLAYLLLQRTLLLVEGPDSLLARAIGADAKGKASAVLYLVGIGLAFIDRWFGVALFVVPALIWLVPDRRIERVFDDTRAGAGQD